MSDRAVAHVVTLPPAEPGFMGVGHTAVPVIEPGVFTRTDPFIFLMDDRVEPRAGHLGEAHPHAGFETVTLMLEGTLIDRDEGRLDAGDALWMTAGSGVIHNEEMTSEGRVRLLQLWLSLPREERWTAPGFQRIPLASLPVRSAPGARVRLYSGRSGAVTSPTSNHVPVTLADVELEPDVSIDQDLPASYHGFVYVIGGSLRVGPDRRTVVAGQVAWLTRPGGEGASSLRIEGGEGGGRALLYAGEPTRAPIAAHGPFVADRREDLVRLYEEFQAGRFPRMSALAAS